MSNRPEEKGALLDNLWLLIGLSLVAGLVQGTSGFGFGLVAMGILVLVMPIQDAAVVVGIIALFSASLNLWTVRHHIPWKDSWPVLVTALPAGAVGIYLLTVLDVELLKAGVAIMIIAGCIVALLAPKGAVIHRAFPWAFIIGLVGGLFGGALGTGGPPIVLYTLLRGWNKAECKAVMSIYFVLLGVERVVLFLLNGVATPHNLRLGVILLVPAMLAVFIGTRVFHRMNNQVFRYVVLALLTATAVNILVT